MENNSDKQLRDKLNSTEFPFDPQAWGQMEAMLDNKKKRRVFFWWWLSGVAAVGLLAVSALLINEVVSSKQITDNRQQTIVNTEVAVNSSSSSKQPNASEQFAKGNKEKSENRNQKLENATAAVGGDSKQTNTSEQLAIGKKQENAKSKKQLAIEQTTRQNTAKKKKEKTVRAGSLFQEPAFAHNYAGTSQSRKNLRRHSLKQNEKSAASSVAILSEQNPFKKEVEMLNEASAKKSAEENISLTRREASLLETVSENATTVFDKKEEDVLPKQKKKIFNYSLGVLANVTGTTLGIQSFSNNERSRPLLFYNKPSYMIGITHDFLFVNRVAITNSILFAQTSFKVYNPKTVSFTTTPKDYTSHITELAIPIGIKIYAVVKNNFRFYISAGIINHIKLKETFDYSYAPDTSATTTPNLVDPVLPDQTNFNTSFQPNTFIANGITSENSTKDFSINSAKRYYASFYAGAGFEYIAKRRFIVFAEPMYYMSLQKIGVQDRRKYNFGITGGFRYQF